MVVRAAEENSGAIILFSLLLHVSEVFHYKKLMIFFKKNDETQGGERVGRVQLVCPQERWIR